MKHISMNQETSTENNATWEVYTPEQSSARLGSYLDVLWRRKLFLLAFILGGTALVIAYTYVMPYTYVAEAKLMPPEEGASRSQSFASLLQTGGIDIGGFGSSQSAMVFVEILRSRTLTDSLIRRLNLKERMELADNPQLATQKVQNGLMVDDAKSGIVTLQYAVETPRMPSQSDIDAASALAAEVANDAVKMLDVLNREKMVTRASRSRDFLKRVTQEKRAALDSARERMAEFQAKNKAFAIDQQLESAVGIIAETQGLIQLKELELAAARQDLNANSSKVEALEAELVELRSQRARLSSTDVLGMNLDATPELVKEYAGLRLDLEVAAQVYTYLESQYHSEQVQAARDLPTVSVLDYAEPPTLRASPRRAFTAMIAFGVLLVFGIGLAFLMELFGGDMRSFRRDTFRRRASEES